MDIEEEAQEAQDQQGLAEEARSSASPQFAQGQIPRRRFIAGMTAVAVGVPLAVSAAGPLPALAAPFSVRSSPFPNFPTGDITTTEDRLQMLWQLGITQPTLPPKAEDPNRPPNAGNLSSPVWNLLGWPGQIIPPGTVFTSGPGESIGGTPPIDVAFIDGTVGWHRHHEGHTPDPDWPFFMQLAARHFNTSRPVVTPGQHFTVYPQERRVVGRVQATDADGDQLGNWQIVGGTGVGSFTIDPNTGEITIANDRAFESEHRRSLTLMVVVDDRKLTSKPEVISIRVEDR